MSQQHWESIYQSSDINSLGWYQADPRPDLDLIQSLNLDLDAKIVIAGAGSTTVVDRLHQQGFTNLIIIDISKAALSSLRDRLGDNDYTWIVDDLTNPEKSGVLPKVDLWYDRAVLHFFTKSVEQERYAELIRSKVRPGGHVILAQFSTSGATRCSGLDVVQYDSAKLTAFLGSDFSLLRQFSYIYTNPEGGERPYIYTLFQRKTTT